MPFENIFVTVGTTKFDALIEQFQHEEVSMVLQKLGCKKLVIQHGNGKIDETKITQVMTKDIQVSAYELKSSIAQDIDEANLVISHAGAGSCIEVLRAGKPLLVIINDELADNHQVELAEQLCADGYLFYCSPKKLADALSKFNASKLKKYEQGHVKEFVRYLDKFMGFNDE